MVSANVSYRGLDASNNIELFTGFQPIILPDDNNQLAPYNLVTAWYWVSGDPEQPISKDHLLAVYTEGNDYADDVLAVFDANGDDDLSADELWLSDDDKVSFIRDKLIDLGLENPRIVGEIEAYALHHNVTHGEWVTSNCESCHNPESLLNASMTLGNQAPANIVPVPIDTSVVGDIAFADDGSMMFKPSDQTPPQDLYVLGHDRLEWVDTLGMAHLYGNVTACDRTWGATLCCITADHSSTRC